jgi:hypothetical protein
MRLLQVDESGVFSLTGNPQDLNPPLYAILSHTWGEDYEEVTFDDIKTGTGEHKKGYEKLRFCAQQAGRDGFKYVWVDTCCIDKSDQTELQYTINSMFRWYQNAAKCYVYLPDVPNSQLDENETPYQLPWEASFRSSRWFTRGWTLQELIAPKVVEFFDKNHQKLGDKKSLERQINDITALPVEALRGNSLLDFSVVERMSWVTRRNTKYPEDKAYCLLGIFGVPIVVNYGEGEGNAFKRLKEELDKLLTGVQTF